MSDSGVFVFDPGRLEGLAMKNREAYAAARPFPHIVIDNFLPDGALEKVLDEFPTPEQIEWMKYDNPAEKKLASRVETQMGMQTRLLLYQLNSSVVVKFLEMLTGIDGIVPDPHFWGGGLHQIRQGGLLKVHADFNRHEKLRLDRRLNLIIYLNKDWKEEYGGHLELWERDMKTRGAKILPVFNRCVIFSTTDFSYHGHPDPLTCPEGWTRKSLALYYYSNGRPAEERLGDHTTLFQHRPGETYDRPEDLRGQFRSAMDAAKPILKKFVPPIVFDVKTLLTKEKH